MRSMVLTAAAIGWFAGSASAAPVVIEDFTNEEGAPAFGMFTWGVVGDGSGSNGGADVGASTVPGPFDLAPDTHYNHITLTDDNFFGDPNGTLFFGEDAAWNLRHIANGGSPATINLVTQEGAVGWFGFYLRTNSPDLVVAPALDEIGGSTSTEVGSRLDVVADGQWHLYQWNLADNDQWDAFFGSSNGVMDGDGYTIDSINFWNSGPENGETSTFDLAYIAYDAEGPLVAIPEPASLALLGVAGLGLAARRRR